MGRYRVGFWSFISLLFFGFHVYGADGVQPFTVVSDIDDTLKITDVHSYYEAVKNGFFGQGVFLGMKELYQELQVQAKSFIYLSGSPQTLGSKTRNLLVQKNGFPDGTFIFNNWLRWDSAFTFKSREMVRLAAASQSSFLLFGDDTESDPEVFGHFNEVQPLRTLSLYIHRVLNRSLPGGVIPYSTAFDIALHEVEEKRLNPEQALRVGHAIYDAQHPEAIFPSFKYCPKDFSYTNVPAMKENESLKEMGEKIAQYVRFLCSLGH